MIWRSIAARAAGAGDLVQLVRLQLVRLWNREALYIYNCRNLRKMICFDMWITMENVDKTVDKTVDNFPKNRKKAVDNSKLST